MAKRRVFISYRRSDSSELTGRLRDRLVQRFGASSVFVDVDSLGPGDEFRSALEAAIRNCDVFLAMIGPDWLQPAEGSSTPRLFGPDDHVRAEVETALQSGVKIIPVLVGAASMPPATSVPSSISDLVNLHAARLRSDPDFHTDVDRLLASAPFRSDWSGAHRRRPVAVAAVGLIGLAIGGLVAIQLARSEPSIVGGPGSGGSLVGTTVMSTPPTTSTPPITSTPPTTSASATTLAGEDEPVAQEDVPLVATAVPVLDTMNSSYWLQGEMPDRSSWLTDATDEEFVMDLANRVDVIAAPSMARLTLENPSDRGMTITDARYRAVSCAAADPTASFRHNYDGGSEVIPWTFLIGGNESGPFEDPMFEEQFFDDQVVTLAPGELVAFDLWFETLTEQCDIVIDLDVTFRGQSSVVTIDQEGEPFRTTPAVNGLPSFQRYWSCIAQFSRYSYSLPYVESLDLDELLDREGEIEDVFIRSEGQWRSVEDFGYDLKTYDPRSGEAPCGWVDPAIPSP